MQRLRRKGTDILEYVSIAGKSVFVRCIIKNAYSVQNSKCEENSQIKALKILRSLFSFHRWDRDEKTSRIQKPIGICVSSQMNMWRWTSKALSAGNAEVCVEINTWCMEGRNIERQIWVLMRVREKDKREEWNIVWNIMRWINRRVCRGEGDVRSHGTVELEEMSRCRSNGQMSGAAAGRTRISYRELCELYSLGINLS